jgi:hypothetical protein
MSVCVSSLFFSFSMLSLSYQRKIGDLFFPDVLVVQRVFSEKADKVLSEFHATCSLSCPLLHGVGNQTCSGYRYRVEQ